MENQFSNLVDICHLTYLCVNNPWRWEYNIERILRNTSKKEFFEIYNEICFAYGLSLDVDDKFFKKYFEDVWEGSIIDPDFEVKNMG